ncbi:MAG: YggT family protein [Chromatiaceae bacterium]|nr:YggT family protein [Gammaproteobacteria bacterium]MCP5427388.1 YggT family protein [Chromatiaceae bacterium]MCB1860449.1 YggT family protein [Gammaproteobacteria bacterium]MCB1871203.1 YggT family protein [Gammaproteobacteria bacterium]MCB1879660.1 YggT family protein [Gammaproteobacteria bacterium]
MGSDYLSNPLIFLIQLLFGLYILVVMLRFLLQLTRADFYNPISQFIVKATSPLLNPLRRVIPGMAGIDLAAVVLMWLLQTIELALIVMISGMGGGLLSAMAWALPELVNLVINVFLFAILIQVILSWVNPGAYNPALGLIHSLTEPVLRPARRMIPPISGLDLSPMLVMVGLTLLKMLLLPPLQMLTGTPFR